MSTATGSKRPAALPEWDRLLSASQKNLPDTIRKLVEEEGVDPSHSNAVRQSALHIAALWGHGEKNRSSVRSVTLSK